MHDLHFCKCNTLCAVLTKPGGFNLWIGVANTSTKLRLHLLSVYVANAFQVNNDTILLLLAAYIKAVS